MKFTKELSIVLAGEAGQGIATIEALLTKILRADGFGIFATKEYMSRIRGGSNSIEIRVSNGFLSAPVDRIDILIPLDNDAITHLQNRLSENTLIFADQKTISSATKIISIPFLDLSVSLGSPIFVNTIAVGFLCALLKVSKEGVTSFITKHFKNKGEELVLKNIQAVESGYAAAQSIIKEMDLEIDIPRSTQLQNTSFISGADAVSLGAIAGGCNFISSYPMTPGTSVLNNLASYEKDIDIIVEQAEDEIAAINMGIGAWYAGARAMVSTSGGGFDLMTEGISLAGIIESPMVIHLAQRPGPATGLPTRTEQADLELAVYSGHGEFPRMVFAPGTIEDAFELSKKAFYFADKFQIPVFILTDQYFVDTYWTTKQLNFSAERPQQFITETGADYKRYALGAPVSPRGIPGFGTGFVCSDSDEHDESGHITEDLDLRVKMQSKRLAKNAQILAESLPPELLGDDNYENLIVCWGSTVGIISEAIQSSPGTKTSILYFKQVYPLHPESKVMLEKAKQLILIEGNGTGQLAKLIKISFGIDMHAKILNFDGMQMSVEKIQRELKAILK